MKKWWYILIIPLFLACEEQEILFSGPYHVRFTDTNLTLKESYSNVIKISVHLVAPQRTEDVTINYSIGGDARENIDYRILSAPGEVEIKRLKSFGYIDIELINNSNNILESQDLILTLESVSSSDLEIGFGPGVRAGETFTFTILDDCILGGTYSSEFPPGSEPFEDISVFSTDCITYTLSNWDINVFSIPDTRNLRFEDNGDNTLTIPEQEEATLPTDLATIRGDGVVDPVTGEIILNIELVDFENSPIVTLNFIPD